MKKDKTTIRRDNITIKASVKVGSRIVLSISDENNTISVALKFDDILKLIRRLIDMTCLAKKPKRIREKQLTLKSSK
jgi:hypothetical protein